MNDKDMEYLGNIRKSPGPNAGRSIDPTKPEPDADAYDRAWDAIAASDELANAQRKLSIHEFRLIIRAVLTGNAARAADRSGK
jgi:hypothetical protein